jgi:hypothetical protein
MKRKYYVQKIEMIEVDEPTFEKLVRCHSSYYPEWANENDYEEAIDRAETITGEKVCEGVEDWEVGITGIYTEDGIPVFEMP